MIVPNWLLSTTNSKNTKWHAVHLWRKYFQSKMNFWFSIQVRICGSLSIKHLRALEPIDIYSPSLTSHHKQFAIRTSLWALNKQVVLLHTKVCLDFFFPLLHLYWFLSFIFAKSMLTNLGWLLPPTYSPFPTHIQKCTKMCVCVCLNFETEIENLCPFSSTDQTVTLTCLPNDGIGGCPG